MRILPILPLVMLNACAASQSALPSLAPRAAAAIDPRVPLSGPAVATAADPALVAELSSLVSVARAGDEAFRAAIGDAGRLAAAAGALESESWIIAQQALSSAIAARAPVTRAIGEIDALGARQILATGGIGPANLAAISQAAALVTEIDEREAAEMASVQARLRR